MAAPYTSKLQQGSGCRHEQQVDICDDLNETQVDVEVVCIKCDAVTGYDVRDK